MSSQEGKGGGGDLSSLPGTRELFLLPPKPSRRCEATYLPTPTCLHCGELCNVKKNKTLVAADGWGRLYRGYVLTIVRAGPVAGIILPCFEVVLPWLERRL